MAAQDDGSAVHVGLDDRAREGLDHLQAAAMEMIKAARALLDVAEELVEDPSTVTAVIGALGSLVQAATGQAGSPQANDDDGERVQRIRVT
jgi:hypothetical protein